MSDFKSGKPKPSWASAAKSLERAHPGSHVTPNTMHDALGTSMDKLSQDFTPNEEVAQLPGHSESHFNAADDVIRYGRDKRQASTRPIDNSKSDIKRGR